MASKPTHRIYTVIKRDGKEDFWLNIGVCFAHEDGQGFNILLQANALDGKYVGRVYKDEPEEDTKGKPSKPAYKGK